MNVIKICGFSRRRNWNLKPAVFLRFRAATHTFFHPWSFRVNNQAGESTQAALNE
jgi:hypothetical protein